MKVMILEVPNERSGPEDLGKSLPHAVSLIGSGSVPFSYYRFMGSS
jgi:hypothetical protein